MEKVPRKWLTASCFLFRTGEDCPWPHYRWVWRGPPWLHCGGGGEGTILTSLKRGDLPWFYYGGSGGEHHWPHCGGGQVDIRPRGSLIASVLCRLAVQQWQPRPIQRALDLEQEPWLSPWPLWMHAFLLLTVPGRQKRKPIIGSKRPLRERESLSWMSFKGGWANTIKPSVSEPTCWAQGRSPCFLGKCSKSVKN